jgi:transcriptional regulator of acetoin/glycerol metabolism
MMTGECEPHAVRSIILKSWQRCSSNKVAQKTFQAPLAAHGDALYRLRQQNLELCMATKEVMASLNDVLELSKSLLLIADPCGVILDMYGNQAIQDAGREKHIAPGGVWNETTGGTNAVGTALANRTPIQVHAMEHFCEGVKSWTCSAALIHSPIDNDIIGVLDISGSDDTFNAHSLPLAVSLARQIETVLRGQAEREQMHLLQWCSEEASAWHNDGLIVLDKKGRVLSMNKRAQESLKRLDVHVKLEKGAPLKGDWRFEFFGISLPAWVKKEWLQPVAPNGKELGMLVVIPQHEVRSATAVPHQNKEPSAREVQARAARATNLLSEGIIGESEAIRSACQKAVRFAAGDFPVLILGETGVGKEEFAAAIHRASPVGNGPFIAINCSVLDKELVGSELFGYADGAFTGARRGGRIGKFEEANGGTLFLDEIGELPPDVQAQLLRILQDGMITRLGENRPRKATVRILSATHCDLRANIGLGRFRQDLYYRLATATLSIPSLRARQGDIAILAAHFMDQLQKKYPAQKKVLSPQLIDVLSNHSWPGNVRELKGMLECMWHLTDNTTLMPADMPDEYQHLNVGQSNRALIGLARTEREAILNTIAENQGSILRAARQLGIARSTLYEKIKKYEIEA